MARRWHRYYQMKAKPMKTLFKILILVLVMASSSLVMADNSTTVADNIGGKGAKHKSLFVVKAHKNLMGAQIEVFTSSGELLTSQTLHRKKMIIDFCDAHLGIYTIKVTKGVNSKEFHFIKK